MNNYKLFTKIRRKQLGTTLTLVVLLTLLLTSTAGATVRTGRWTGLGPSDTVTGTRDGQEYSYSAGTMKFQINGGDLVPTFCTDFRHGVTSDIDYAATEEELRCELVWLMQNYPPDLAGNSQEMSARQAAVWHFSDGFDPVQSGHDKYTEAVEGRAWEIIGEAEAASCDGVMRGQPNLAISPLNASQPEGQMTIAYTIAATTGGEPIAGLDITLENSFGVLSDSTVTTGPDGTATFDLTNNVGGPASAVITATAWYTFGVGTAFKVIDDVDSYQWLILGEETVGDFFAGASATWLPNSSVTAHVFQDLNNDGIQGDDDEINLDNWQVTLEQSDGAGGWNLVNPSPKTTASDGTVSWQSLAAGDYKASLTLQSSWFNTTPIEVEFTLPASGSQYVDFGVIRLPIINACVYYDQDRDGSMDESETWLNSWAVAVVDGPGGALQGQSGQTENGCVIFSWPRDQSFVAGDYVVQETLQNGWINSTPVSLTVTLASGSNETVYFGNYDIHPAIVVTETVTPGTVHGSDAVTWEVVVTNTGDDTLTDVTLTDDNGHNYGVPFTLTVGASQTFTYTTNPTGDVTNQVTATGEDALGETVSDDDTASVSVINPDIQVTETATPGTVYDGNTVTWEVVVTNTGDDTLTNVILTNDNNSHSYGDPFTLTVGTSVTFTYTTNPNDDVTNQVTAIGTDTLGSTVSDDDTASVNTIDPAIQVIETVTPGTIYSGDTVTWEIVVTNTGDDLLTNVILTDTNGHNYGDSFTLTVGTSVTFTYTTNPNDDVTNPVTAIGQDSLGGTVSDDDTASVHVINPGLDVVETVTPGTIYSGNTATWQIVVTNNGDDTLTDITLSDDNGHNYGDPFTLTVGTSVTFTYATNPSADVTNLVTASGQDSLGNPVEDSDDASVNVINPAIQVIETADPTMVYVGNLVNWEVVVTNVGDDPLTQVTMADLNGHPYGASFDLAVGKSVTFTYTTNPTVDVTDVVTATGKDSLNGTVTDNDSASVGVIDPAIQVVESVNPPLVYTGEAVTWEIIVTNVGNDPLTQVTLTDDNGHDYGTTFDLAIGDSKTFTYTTNVTMTTENDVTAVGTDSLGGAVTDDDSAIVNVISPDIQVVESVTPDTIHSGDQVVWQVTVSNNSSDPLTNITLTDDNGHDYGVPFNLAVGESKTFTYTTAPTGNTTNLVTALGYDSLGGQVSDSATAQVKLINPAVQVIKTVSADMIYGGQSVEWTITVFNRGDTTLYNVTVTDSNGMTFGPLTLTADNGSDGSGTDQSSWTYETYPGYDTTNIATANGTDELGLVVTDQDQASVIVDNECPGGPPCNDNDDDGTPDYLDGDDDGDGLSSEDECPAGPPCEDSDGDGTPDYLDDDDDGDGISTSDECPGGAPCEDSDGDGTPDYLDDDDDGDGILTSDECPAGPPCEDSDGDGTPDYLDDDDDGDGILTSDECPAGPPCEDSDGDGTPDYLDDDDDGDGVSTSDECPAGPPCQDSDGDGTPDYLDDDDDGDGVSTNDECPAGPPCQDSDGDGTPDYLDDDDDGDGVSTSDECPAGPPCQDSDGDGTPDYLDGDDDGDGVSTSDECPAGPPCEDSDGDGTPDYLDDDDDGDGVSTSDECPAGPPCEDSDGDGTPDYLDNDDDDDGIPTNIECPSGPPCQDNDGDGTPDYQDLDSDGDGIPDSIEAGDNPSDPADTDGDGTPDYQDIDSDGDGIPDSIEAGDDPTNPVDTDGDGTPDYLDLDSDGDGIPDSIEAGDDPTNPVDTDGDGTPDYLDLDSDGDGILDTDEWSENSGDPLAGCTADDPVCFNNDADGDGFPNYLDNDSDGDGISDTDEYDADGNEIPDDSDNDGIPDWLDPVTEPAAGPEYNYFFYLPFHFALGEG
ncbi:MAG: Cys-Gln thioester bond-forming surface protein [Chloroflexi bacterium]|nr:Cys-Gln thioester bond-forming surface protein [Chloroflexota bacterium]